MDYNVSATTMAVASDVKKMVTDQLWDTLVPSLDDPSDTDLGDEW